MHCFFQFVIGDFQVVSDTNPIDTSRELRKNKIRIITNKAKKSNHLCIDDREYYSLKTEAVAVDEYTKLSLSSENTDDSHIPLLSLNHCDDISLTTVSDESESATAVHVYNLSKRETKIFRHDIIKRSRIPIGRSSKDSLDGLDICCGSTNDHNSQKGSTSVLGSTIKDFSNCVCETIKSDEIKPLRSIVQLKSVHPNRTRRKLEMENVQKMNSALGTSLDVKDVGALQMNFKPDQVTAGNIEIDKIADSKKLIEIERNNVYIESNYDAQKMYECVANNDAACESYPSKKFEQPKDDGYSFSNAESKVDCAHLIDPISDENIEVSDASDLSEDISPRKPTEEIHPFKHVQDYERGSDIKVHVSGHKEKSVIEEDVISLLPSVKALAQTFSQHVNKQVSKQFHHPQVRVVSKKY